jgi:[protein-PII] uridylyltransferase
MIYKYVIRNHFGDYSPMQNSIPISLLALGSYGREQLSIYSDIDLLIVYKDIKGYNIKEIIESLLSMAWDSGFKLGHRVHEIDDLLPASREDHTIKSSIIESRFICGSKFIWIETQNKIQQIKQDNQEEFIKTKLEEFWQRREKYPIVLRANIKEGVGGLRDLNTIYWIATTLHNVKLVRDLIPMIDENLYIRLIKSIEFLFRVRVALHLSSSKKEDTLRLELIPDVAKYLNLTQRGVATKIYKALFEISVISEIFIDDLIKPLNIVKPSSDVEIDNELFIYENRLYSRSADCKKSSFDVIESIKNYLADIKEYDISFIRYLSNSKTRDMISMQSSGFVRDLLECENIYPLFFALYRAKILFKIFTPLSKVRYLPQFDGYHKYPVDLHSLYTLKALEDIKDPFVKELYETLDNKQISILKLAAFLHDSGKGRKKDHSQLGSIIVKSFALKIGFDKEESEYIYRLVRYHTLMSNTSAREDIYNEKVIYSFISKIRDPLTLKLLYILTYADIASVSEDSYSNFNSKLLYELYHISLDAFRHNAMIGEASKRAKMERELKRFKPFLELKRVTQKRILSIESNLLFFKYTPTEITVLAKDLETLEGEYSYKVIQKDPLEFQILSTIELNVGYLLGKLYHLDIVTMDIFKVGRGVKFFKIGFLHGLEDEEISFLQEIVKESFDMSKKVKLPRLDIKPKEIDINCSHSSSYARMKVNCKDQKGLVANIIAIFDDMGVDIASAKIQTMKNRARNLFLIEKNGNFCTAQNIIIDKLTKG